MFVHLSEVFTLYGFIVVVGLCVAMVRLYLSWMVCCSWSANVCCAGGVSKL